MTGSWRKYSTAECSKNTNLSGFIEEEEEEEEDYKHVKILIAQAY